MFIGGAISYLRGHKIRWNNALQRWRYDDDGSSTDKNRPCVRCGRMPTPEGYDACLGHIEGVVSACCGHGESEPILIKARDKRVGRTNG